MGGEVFPVEMPGFHPFWHVLPEAADAVQHAGKSVRDHPVAPNRQRRPGRALAPVAIGRREAGPTFW